MKAVLVGSIGFLNASPNSQTNFSHQLSPQAIRWSGLILHCLDILRKSWAMRFFTNNIGQVELTCTMQWPDSTMATGDRNEFHRGMLVHRDVSPDVHRYPGPQSLDRQRSRQDAPARFLSGAAA